MPRGLRAVPRSLYQQLESLGLRSSEAGNVTAYLNGLAPVSGGWTIEEVERLLFVRYLDERRQLRA